MLNRLGPLAGTGVLPSPYQPRDRRGQGPHSMATALPEPGSAIASSAPGIVVAVCSYAVEMLSWAAGRWAHRHGGHWGTILISGTLENKERKMPKTKGALGRPRC